MERWRERRADLDPGAGTRLGETEFRGVEEIAAERRQSNLADVQAGCCAVEGVAYDRMMESGEVHADLVRATSVELNFHEGGGADASQGLPVGAGFAGVGEHHTPAGGHANAALWIAADGEIDAAAVFPQQALDEGDVRFLDGAPAEGFSELGMRCVIFCDEDYAGGIFVEAMNDSRAQRVTTLRQCLTAAEQGVDERSMSISGAGVNGHASGLVDDHDVFIFIEDVERDGFGCDAEGRAGLHFDGEALAATKSLRAFRDAGIEKDESCFD